MDARYETLQVEIADGVARAALHRPEAMNAMNVEMMRELQRLALACEAAGDTERASELFTDLAAYNFNAVGYALIRADVLQRAES